MITSLLLGLALAPAAAALDWTHDPVAQLRLQMANLPPVAAPSAIPTAQSPAAEEPFECRPLIIAAFREAWSRAGSGWKDYEAAFRVDRTDSGYEIEFMPMTHEPLQLPVKYYPTKTVAIVHTHPDTAEPTPGPGDYAAKVPNYVLSRRALHVTIPGTKRHRFVRRDWDKPCTP